MRLILLLLCIVGLSMGQLAIVSPTPRKKPPTDQKINTSPCGGSQKGQPLTTLTHGENFTIEWKELDCKNGAPFRIAFAESENRNEFNKNIIIDHIPQNKNCVNGQNYTFEITVPDIACNNCTLQISQILTNKPSKFCPSTTPEDWTTRYACADIQILGSVPPSEYQNEDQSPPDFRDSGLSYGRQTAVYSQNSISEITYQHRPECYYDCSKDDVEEDEICEDDDQQDWRVFCNDMIESSDRMFCLKWKIYPEVIYWVMEAKTNGWAAFGISDNQGMENSDHYVMYHDQPTGKISFIGRYSPGKTRVPVTEASQNGLAIQTSSLSEGEMIEEGPVMRTAFARFYVTGDPHDLPIQKDRVQYLLWALHESENNIDIKHTHRIKFGIRIDWFSEDQPFEEYEGVASLLTDHGILMFVSWGIFAMAGHMVARYKRDMKNWFYVHVALLSFGSFFNMIAFSIVVHAVNEISSPHFSGFHQVIGLLIFIFSVLQPALGLASHLTYDPKRTKVPIWPDQIHMWFGRVGLVVCIVNILIGIIRYRSHQAITAFYCIYMVSLLIFIGYMEWRNRKLKGHVTRYGEVENVEEKGDGEYKKFEDNPEDKQEEESHVI